MVLMRWDQLREVMKRRKGRFHHPIEGPGVVLPELVIDSARYRVILRGGVAGRRRISLIRGRRQ